MNYLDQPCCLCGIGAHYYQVDAKNRKFFDCANCTQYQISIDAEKKLEKCSTAQRDHYARRAKDHPDGTLLVILRDWVDGKDELVVSYVAKSDLPLKPSS